MARKLSIYSKVDFKKLKKELFNTMEYLASQKVNDELKDDIDWRLNKKGGVNPTVVSSIEKQIETQMNQIETCSNILKVIFEKEGLSENVKKAIEILTLKLEEIETYFDERPISEINKRYAVEIISGKSMSFMAASKEDRINSRTRILAKIFKVKPLITELETMKEEVILKGGYEIPESMMYEE